MISLLIFFILSCALLWLLVMYGVWRKDKKQENSPDIVEALTPTYNKVLRLMRRVWFLTLRYLQKIWLVVEKLLTRAFFTIFPNARKAFEKKDELTGLEHGPSSYFLMSVSEYKDELKKAPSVEEKKIRRNKKNV